MISGAAVVTAVFTTEPSAAAVRLMMAAVPADAGVTYPAGGATTLRKGAAAAVAAAAADGWTFTRWTFTGDMVVDDSSAASATIMLFGDAILTANFARLDPLAGEVRMTSTHKETVDRKRAVATSKDAFSLTVKTTLAADVPLPAAGEPLTFSVSFGDYYFLGATEDGTVAKAKYDSKKGGLVLFKIKDDTVGKVAEQISFSWNAKRQLIVMVKGAPASDPECGVVNFVDLTMEADGPIAGKVADCSVLFVGSELELPGRKRIPYKGKKSSKDSLVSWSIKGGVK